MEHKRIKTRTDIAIEIMAFILITGAWCALMTIAIFIVWLLARIMV